MDAIVEFLLQPISGSDEHYFGHAHKWHARWMVVAWGVMVPLGILIARYFKITARQDWPTQLDNRTWWIAHLVLQIGAFALTLVALAYVLDLFDGVLGAIATDGIGLSGVAGLAPLHALLGWAVVALASLQVLGGALRGTHGHRTVVLDAELRARLGGRGDHFQMTLRRRVFEYAHKLCGYLALALAALNIVLGLAMADAPRWMWLVIGGFWLLLGSIAVRLQRQGRCVDTYQAIYGPAPDLPGNRRRPIGWGIRRYGAGEWPPVPHSRRSLR